VAVNDALCVFVAFRRRFHGDEVNRDVALSLVDELEEQGKILVIRPERPVVVGRMEKDISKLEALYEEGFLLGERFVQEHLLGGLSSDASAHPQL